MYTVSKLNWNYAELADCDDGFTDVKVGPKVGIGSKLTLPESCQEKGLKQTLYQGVNILREVRLFYLLF